MCFEHITKLGASASIARLKALSTFRDVRGRAKLKGANWIKG